MPDMPITEEQAEAIVKSIYADRNYMTVEMPVSEAWMVSAALGAAARVPDLHVETVDGFKTIATIFRDAIAARHADAKPTLDDTPKSFTVFADAATPFFADNVPLTINIRVRSAWMVVTAIQMVTRHADASAELREKLTQTGRNFQAAIATLHPDSNVLMEMGWNAAFDVARGEAETLPDDDIDQEAAWMNEEDAIGDDDADTQDLTALNT